MWVPERQIGVVGPPDEGDWLKHIEHAIGVQRGRDEALLRFVISESSSSGFSVEYLVLSGAEKLGFTMPGDVLQFVRRPFEDSSSFNAVLIIPTGVGAELGGHAGDGGPLAALLCAVCDRVLTHPNVVNGSDLNEMPDNVFYVEGSVLSRLLLGNIALQPVRANKILVIIDDHQD